MLPIAGRKLRRSDAMNQIERARMIARTLGAYKAARYLKARGWSIEAALHIVTSTKGVKSYVRRPH